MAVVRIEYDYAVSFQSFQECPHQKLFFDLKDKNYKKAKMKGGLGWMKNIGNDPARFLMGTIFLVLSVCCLSVVCQINCVGGIT